MIGQRKILKEKLIEMSKKFKAAIIGVGNVGFRYTSDPLRKWICSHLQAYKEHPHFIPVSVCDIDKNRLIDAKRYIPTLNTYSSWEKMLQDEEIDILSVCVSGKLNFEVCTSSSISKLRAIILEKPLSADTRIASKIVKVLRSKKIAAAVNYFRRWQKTFWLAKELVLSGEVGEIFRVDATYPAGIWAGGSHMIDILQYLLGNFQKVKTLNKVSGFRKDDPIYSVLAIMGNAEVYLRGVNKSYFNIFEIELWGRRGMIIIHDFGRRITVKHARKSHRFSGQKELFTAKEASVEGYNNYFYNLLTDLSNAMLDKKAIILCPPEEALKTTKIIVAIEDSYKHEREISLTWR